MIIRIFDYRATAKGLVGHSARQNNTFRVALSRSRYVVGLDSDPGISAAARDEEEHNHLGREQLTTARILQVYSDNLPPGELIDKVNMFSIHAASGGIEHLYHVVFSNREDEPVDPPMRAAHRRIFRRVMRTEGCPVLGSDHGDTGKDHGHDLTVTVDATSGKPVPFGQFWPKEAAQIAVAICEHHSGLIPEPNRRYVADESGVYHTFSDTLIADPAGNILLDKNGQPDRALIRSVQMAADMLEKSNEATGDCQPGGEWSLARALGVLAAPRIEKAQTWEQIHRSLARVGLRYVKLGTEGALIAVGYGKELADRERPASAAYSGAALRILRSRIGEFEWPPEGFVVRPFVMPRYNAPKRDHLSGAKIRRSINEQGKEVQTYLRCLNRERQNEIYDSDLKGGTNFAIKEQAERAAIERQLVKRVVPKSGSVSRYSSADIATWVSAQDDSFNACLWSGGVTSSGPRDVNEEDEFAARYRKRRGEAGIEYALGGQSAFLETQNLILLRGRDSQLRIDALRRARRKFGALKVMAHPDESAELIEIAAELGIRLDPSQEALGERHLSRIRTSPEFSHLRRHDAQVKRRQQRVEGLRILRQLRRYARADRQERRRHTHSWTEHQIKLWRHDNAMVDSHRKAPNPIRDPLIPAMLVLDSVDRDELRLPSSRFDVSGVRYLDDVRLRRAFESDIGVLVRPEMQLRLSAIERVQRQQRDWLCAAIISGRVTPDGDTIKIIRSEDQWASSFYRHQRSDPQFQRLLATARARPERFAQFDFQRPEMVTWRSLRGRSPFEWQLAAYVADELHRATTTDERDALFRSMPFEEARTLREVPGRFYKEYLTKYYRDPKASSMSARRKTTFISRREGRAS